MTVSGHVTSTFTLKRATTPSQVSGRTVYAAPMRPPGRGPRRRPVPPDPSSGPPAEVLR